VAPRGPRHETFAIESSRLGEVRRINLYLPTRTSGADVQIPVLYVLDGGDDEDFPHPGIFATIDLAIRTGEMRPLVVVGIENTERRRDMTGPTQRASDETIAAHVGGSAAFRGFIRDELMPVIRRRVGPSSQRAIVGESLAGLFVVETLFVEPELFDVYIAVSPSLWWNDAALARSAGTWFRAHSRLRNILYLAHGGDDDRDDAIAALGVALRSSAPPGLAWTFEPRSDLRHANIYETVMPSVFRSLWPPEGDARSDVGIGR
jgi:predicted alpha/beta superfamily hydrolase